MVSLQITINDTDKELCISLKSFVQTLCNKLVFMQKLKWTCINPSSFQEVILLIKIHIATPFQSCEKPNIHDLQRCFQSLESTVSFLMKQLQITNLVIWVKTSWGGIKFIFEGYYAEELFHSWDAATTSSKPGQSDIKSHVTNCLKSLDVVIKQGMPLWIWKNNQTCLYPKFPSIETMSIMLNISRYARHALLYNISIDLLIYAKPETFLLLSSRNLQLMYIRVSQRKKMSRQTSSHKRIST